MLTQQDIRNHIHTTLRYAWQPARELTDRDTRRASFGLWHAAADVVAAVAIERGWQRSSHRDMKNVVKRLAAEPGNEYLDAQFAAIEKFYMNLFHDVLEPHDIETGKFILYDFVDRMLTLLPSEQKTSEASKCRRKQ